jgi:hypothetical protein
MGLQVRERHRDDDTMFLSTSPDGRHATRRSQLRSEFVNLSCALNTNQHLRLRATGRFCLASLGGTRRAFIENSELLLGA